MFLDEPPTASELKLEPETPVFTNEPLSPKEIPQPLNDPCQPANEMLAPPYKSDQPPNKTHQPPNDTRPITRAPAQDESCHSTKVDSNLPGIFHNSLLS